MFTTEPGPDRWRLGFAEAVKSSFAFVKGYGLKPVREEVTLVRYQSAKVILNVYHGRSSYELGTEFERMGFPEKFGLYEMLKWAKSVGEIEEIPTDGYQASSREGVQRLVVQMAQVVKRYAEPLLRGDTAVYATLRERQSRDAATYERGMRLRAAREQAETAWREKDYETLLSLYGDMQDDLTKSELMRVQYAQKQLLSVRNSQQRVG